MLVGSLLIAVTANSWWRVKETGRRARIAAAHEAAMRDAESDAPTADDALAFDGGTE